MKGVLLCGGEGTRLRPLTLVTNKHLLRIGRRPMIEYPLQRLIQAGITEVHVVTGGENYPPLVRYLGSGSRFGISITYSIQDEAGGIAQALALAESCVGGEKMAVVLGDNIFEMNLTQHIEDFKDNNSESICYLFTTKSKTPERFGVIKWGRECAEDIIEKPLNTPPSDDIITGIYFYTSDVFDKIRTLRPSDRGELEITDVNRLYIKEKNATVINLVGDWTDGGTFESLINAERQVGG